MASDLRSSIAFASLSVVYFFLGFTHRSDHLQYNDGTFSINAPFGLTLVRSAVLVLWPSGLLGLFASPVLRREAFFAVLPFTIAWMLIALLPYSFMTYTPYLPSRHTFLACSECRIFDWVVTCVCMEQPEQQIVDEFRP